MRTGPVECPKRGLGLRCFIFALRGAGGAFFRFGVRFRQIFGSRLGGILAALMLRAFFASLSGFHFGGGRITALASKRGLKRKRPGNGSDREGTN